MEVRRVFVDTLEITNGLALLKSGPMYKYIVTVLRKTVGGRMDLVDGKGCLYRCVISSIKGKEIALKVLETEEKPEENRPRITLVVSPIKGPRMDWLIEKATELGVDCIIPAGFTRTVVRAEGKEKEKYERWRRIAIEASRQSGRLSVPEVMEPMPLKGILPHIAEAGNRWTLYEKEKQTTMKDLVARKADGGVCVVIGPEGGMEELEVAWLTDNGFTPCTLGDRILRSETAPLVILSIILYEHSLR